MYLGVLFITEIQFPLRLSIFGHLSLLCAYKGQSFIQNYRLSGLEYKLDLKLVCYLQFVGEFVFKRLKKQDNLR